MMPELYHSLRFIKWAWTQPMFLYLLFSGSCSSVTVKQPPVLTAAVHQTVLLPCQLILSNDEKLKGAPILYWEHLEHKKARLWPSSGKYRDRVDLLDPNPSSYNKSILLKDVQWADSGKYQCKVSIHTTREKSRKCGDTSRLLVHDSVSLKLTNNSLHCEVNVTHDPSLVLSVYWNGSKLVAPTQQDAALAFVTLSSSVDAKSAGIYECQLQLNTFLITSSSLEYFPPDLAEVVFPEPWLLYSGLLVVPIIFLLGITTAFLTDSC